MPFPRKFLPLGARFRCLTILTEGPHSPTHTCYTCRCDCGVVLVVQAGNLRAGNTKSCGCQKPAWCRAGRLRHGGTKTKLYYVWWTMKQRCQNPRASKYPDYGGRGITLCVDWHTFDAFQIWARANGYAEGLQIDRRENNGPYSPDNCRWVTRSAQMRNQRPRGQRQKDLRAYRQQLRNTEVRPSG